MVGQGPTLEELKRRSDGDFYSGEELEEMNPRNLLDALRRLAPDMVGPEGGQPGSRTALQGRIRTAQGVNPPIVVFDGVLVGDGTTALRDFRPQDVASMEILKGASRGWEYGTGGAGGVIKVVTRHGDVGYGIAHPDRCDVEGWNGRPGPGGIPRG
jgi:outer membrane cobalamin receptor